MFNDPYMQVKSLKALALLGNPSDELDAVLQTIVSSTVARKNTGRSILYQSVEAVVALSHKTSLRALAFNQVGRLLVGRDPNVLYSALSVFARVLYKDGVLLKRTGVDSTALQRYKGQIVKLLNHRDPSIRRRALDVISALIDADNAPDLVPEILSYLRLADAEFRSELVSKIYAAVDQYSPNVKWFFDSVHQLIIESGNYVSMEIVSSFCDLVARTVELQRHAVSRMSQSLVSFSGNQTLVQVASFIVGEFAAEDNGCVEVLGRIVVLPLTGVEIKLYILTALA
jgi:hypothetical protein